MSSERLEEIVKKVEEFFVKCGAAPAGDLDSNRFAAFGERLPYVFEGEYYRVEAVVMENKDYLFISTIDDKNLANVSIMDDIAAFPADYPEEKIEKEVRFALGIEPYPEGYPDY